MGNKENNYKKLKMKVLTILCTISLFISALSWARNLSDEETISNEDIIQKLEELERQN